MGAGPENGDTGLCNGKALKRKKEACQLQWNLETKKLLHIQSVMTVLACPRRDGVVDCQLVFSHFESEDPEKTGHPDKLEVELSERE
mmetsp:Transcript_91428/g.153178  ORF Transcript_91428/g.153178 Transcript_91428/m.153178 type:complete len:87 (+) Transcript_91428:197-457(+)|eukprot:CAMPEP_0174301084 /NCGR_PEP_ID=MMETSP0809-20121228/58841_1 /TAXON_ID=73025 ORGANISM="Eutreptiella gymnastica-like, Strain CCMP1594" /NCGR_SAMPLE_ID=MMETSP0809 /ASSEMBLY_ACC=CAM_ASM_000658 /LENGTH=86 /DNA_ID=CAMNT_0015406769 /DNA_START=670 /DNA_END=930 /DNA_ORIENTATION=-